MCVVVGVLTESGRKMLRTATIQVVSKNGTVWEGGCILTELGRELLCTAMRGRKSASLVTGFAFFPIGGKSVRNCCIAVVLSQSRELPIDSEWNWS